MEEERVEIAAPDGVILEGRLGRGVRGQGGLVCHPHPLYGGTMDSSVVLAARDALAGLGLTTLRFNFRGAGGSGGEHDGGRGELLDLRAAFSLLSAVAPEGVHLVAYSFGAWVAVKALAAGLSPRAVVLISPPVEFLDFSGLGPGPRPTLVVSGDLDEFGPAQAVSRWIGSLPTVERVLLPGVDHFYRGAEAALGTAIARFLEPRLGGQG